MDNVFNREKEKWIRPWDQEKFDDLYNRDERFFAIIMKGLMSWLDRNIRMYGKPIHHFIFNTGSSYLYIESNGYEYNLSETTGEDTIYMSLPRCILELQNIRFPTEELSAAYSRGNYERRSGNMLCGYNAELQRIPVELSIRAQYYLGTFNEAVILAEELMNTLVFQKYFKVTYLGNIIQCSIEFPAETSVTVNKIDMASAEPNQRIIELNLNICTNYPNINERTEIPTDKVIQLFGHEVDLYLHDHPADSVDKGVTLEDNGFEEFENGTVSEKEDQVYDNITGDTSDDTGDTSVNVDDIKDDWMKLLDTNGDGVIDLDDLIARFDLNGDGVLDEYELQMLLDRLKYESYDEGSDYTEECHYKIDYRDLYYAIKVYNKQSGITVDYDKFGKKIYVTHLDTGETAIIDLIKYKIIKDDQTQKFRMQ